MCKYEIIQDKICNWGNGNKQLKFRYLSYALFFLSNNRINLQGNSNFHGTVSLSPASYTNHIINTLLINNHFYISMKVSEVVNAKEQCIYKQKYTNNYGLQQHGVIALHKITSEKHF